MVNNEDIRRVMSTLGKAKNPRKGFGSMSSEQKAAARAKGLETRRRNALKKLEDEKRITQ